MLLGCLTAFACEFIFMLWVSKHYSKLIKLQPQVSGYLKSEV